MNVSIFGISCVGKSTVDKAVVERLGYDLDDEVKKYYHCTLEEFINTGKRWEKDGRLLFCFEKKMEIKFSQLPL